MRTSTLCVRITIESILTLSLYNYLDTGRYQIMERPQTGRQQYPGKCRNFRIQSH